MSNLSSGEKEALLNDGAIRKQGVGWVLSDSLVPDCRVRVEMAGYFARVVAGRSENNDADRKFAAEHSREIVVVLRRLWPSLNNSKALIGDGNFYSEKYNLLTDPALDESAIAPLISDIMDKEGMTGDIAFVLFSRPMVDTKAALIHQLRRAEGSGEVSPQIFILALLHKLGDPTASSKLRKLYDSKRSSDIERKSMSALLIKIKRGDEIRFSDVEDLAYKSGQP